MEQKVGPSHDAMDALVAAVISWYQRYFAQAQEPVDEEVAFSDEWERKQIARELHWN